MSIWDRNAPLPKSLAGECKKAAKTLNFFVNTTSDGTKFKGLDKFIPTKVILNAKGLVIMTIIKAGFIWSGRLGSGIVVARLGDGSWSAPSCIGSGGIGVGLQIGAELTDFVMVLNTQNAIDAFCHRGNVTLGGNLSVAAGPIGRQGEVDAMPLAAVYCYSRTGGLFAGISLEGTAIVERKDANKKCYGRSVTVKELLTGMVARPPEAFPLYNILDSKFGSRSSLSLSPTTSPPVVSRQTKPVVIETTMTTTTTTYQQPVLYAVPPPMHGVNPEIHGGPHLHQDPYQVPQGYPPGYQPPSNYSGDHDMSHPGYSPSGYQNPPPSSEYQNPPPSSGYQNPPPSSGYQNPPHSSGYQNPPLSSGYHNPPPSSEHQNLPLQTSFSQSVAPSIPRRSVSSPASELIKARALYDFTPQSSTDLGFQQGDELIILQFNPEWSLAEINGRKGQIPTNYVQIIPNVTAPPPLASRPTNPFNRHQSSETLSTLTPQAPVPSPQLQARALYPFVASSEKELGFNEGDTLVILDRQGEWWLAEFGGKRGLVPSNFVQLI
eukprot:TRINITY_DN595_c0_g1_i1.p1 TRINITY_DN595_c0_g1~~TRINITY_DN595_c0_g1_i1.p1  ORF type:complete len:548 (-),score=97.51 TRINITY_DN595_c0_g1_i1:152-1795(-)